MATTVAEVEAFDPEDSTARRRTTPKGREIPRLKVAILQNLVVHVIPPVRHQALALL